MSDMIERVARAVCEQGGFDPDDTMPNDGPRWKYYVPGARAAIQAMRSPTKDMYQAGFDAGYLGDGEWQYADPEATYSAMIDQALSIPKPKETR